MQNSIAVPLNGGLRRSERLDPRGALPQRWHQAARLEFSFLAYTSTRRVTAAMCLQTH